MTAVVDDAQKQLDWEARQRPRAGVAAVLATIGLIGGLWGNLQLGKDLPSPSGLATLQRALRPGPVDDLTSLQVSRMQYIVDHQFALITLGVVGLIAAVASAWALGFLAVATRGRRPEVKRWVVYLPIVGGVLSGLATFLGVVGELLRDNDFLDGARTVADAANNSGLLVFVQWLGFFGLIASAGGYLLVSLNAMRAGLLTRLLGYVGIATGVFFIIPIPLFGPLLQVLFQAALALLFFRAWMGGMPPAWESGRAEPLPARQPMQRRAAPAPEPQPAGPAAPEAPRRSKRKKRH